MVLMAIDHASQTWNAGRLSADSAYLLDPATGEPPPGSPARELDVAQFLTRWITHLCAPTFLFLSGTSLAMSLERRRSEGAKEGALDRHLFIRALVILGFEGLLTLLAGQGVLILQVLCAIGASMLAMIVLRRLPTRGLLALGLAWLAGSELFMTAMFPVAAPTAPTGAAARAALLRAGLFGAGLRPLSDDPLARDDAARLGLRTSSARARNRRVAHACTPRRSCSSRASRDCSSRPSSGARTSTATWACCATTRPSSSGST